VRVLVVGGGCRGLVLTRSLVADGHAVRVVTRSEARRAEIEAAGGECWIGDPDRIGTLRYALANVTVLLWALGTVPEPSLHGSRLEMMLERTVDTMVRGVIYEGDSSEGRAIVERMCRLNELPYLFVAAEPADREAWAAAVSRSIDALLTAQRPSVTGP
jgi:hypothetical protein